MKYIGAVTIHHDVWGHQFRDDCPDCGGSCEGWQVNDSTRAGTITIYKHAEDGAPTDAEVIQAAKDQHLADLSECESDGSDGETWRQESDGMPVLSIDWTEERERLKFAVEFEVDETWIADGFDLDDDRAMDMLRKTLGWAREDELGARVTSAPDSELIKWLQGARKDRP